jgi:hypothetical protein
MSNKNIFVTKASGIQDVYSAEKLRRSLSKSGASEQMIHAILHQIGSKLYNGIPTKEIYQAAFELLKKNSRGFANRYNLKRAIMALGPSGFPFEQYIGDIFEWMGYKVKVKQFLEGVCVRHEIDVLAENDRHVLLIECKYHNRQGVFSDVKVPLYIHSRYRDVLGMWNKTTPKKKLEGSVVTNTKFSADAIKYGVCAGLHLLGWNYPEQKSLSSLVDESGLYPVTCLTTLNNNEKERILKAGVVLCRELRKNEDLLRQSAISQTRIPKVLAEIEEVYNINTLTNTGSV